MSLPKITFNNGVSMEAIGLGTWIGYTREEQWSGLPWIKTAIEVPF